MPLLRDIGGSGFPRHQNFARPLRECEMPVNQVLLDHGLTGLQTKTIITIVMHDENPNNNTKNNNNNDEKKLCRASCCVLFGLVNNRGHMAGGLLKPCTGTERCWGPSAVWAAEACCKSCAASREKPATGVKLDWQL